ncbi:MAG: hypothetical protein II109_02250, partial [Paludibacteraceae bacterium]|nr:hypothetical protein [Paludibacteraceae bacterium]
MAATYSDIVKQISIKQFMPIYIFMGTESYYIDKLTELLEASILTDDEKVMNETVIFGKDAVMENILTDARQYPVMAPYRVIFLKEAQMLANKNKLSLIGKYLEHPVSSTIIVVTYKNGVIDSRKKENKEWLSKAEKLGVVFTSEKIREYQLPPIVTQMADKEGLDIDDKAVNLLIEHEGQTGSGSPHRRGPQAGPQPAGGRRSSGGDHLRRDQRLSGQGPRGEDPPVRDRALSLAHRQLRPDAGRDQKDRKA